MLAVTILSAASGLPPWLRVRRSEFIAPYRYCSGRHWPRSGSPRQLHSSRHVPRLYFRSQTITEVLARDERCIRNLCHTYARFLSNILMTYGVIVGDDSDGILQMARRLLGRAPARAFDRERAVADGT